MEQTLIVARVDPSDVDTVARIFEESDRTDLPAMLGVRQRHLFQFHGLYMHLIESSGMLPEQLAEVRRHPLFVDVNDKLKPYVEAYDPATWRSPVDAMAGRFYSWRSA